MNRGDAIILTCYKSIISFLNNGRYRELENKRL
jgi:hypothetical protein